ncbi:MAG: hypothetical protein WDZ81_01090 [Candidatus Saccharimonadales bacterium]
MSIQELQIPRISGEPEERVQSPEATILQAAEATPMSEIASELLASGHRITNARSANRVKKNGVLTPIRELLLGEKPGFRDLINQEAGIGGTVFRPEPGELLMFFFLDENTIVFQRYQGTKNTPLPEQIRYDIEGGSIYVARDGMHHQNITGTQDARDLFVAVKLAEHRTINTPYSVANRN